MAQSAKNKKQNPEFFKSVEILKKAMRYVEEEDLFHELQEKLAQVERRLRDPYLKLSVIGDFSCGKSTLLNAVFGRELLSTDMMPTTAIPTYIRWDRKPSEGVGILVHDCQGSVYNALSEDLIRLEQYVGKTFDQELGTLIDALTTNNTLAGKISKVEISFPELAGREGICLIDTPGINPGMEGTREHVGITRRLLSEEADAAIVLFPGSLVLTGGLLEFLKESASHLLRDSYFIITKFDLVRRQKDRELMPELVSGMMRDITGKTPKVYTVSAGMALDCYMDPVGAPPEAKKWAEGFERDIGEIFADVALCRERIIKEHLVSMLRELTGKLVQEIESGNAVLEEDRKKLELYSPQQMKKDVRKFCDLAVKQIDRAEAKYKKDIDAAVQTVFAGKKSTIRTAIMAKESMGAVNSYLENGLNTDLSDMGSLLAETVKEVNPNLPGIVKTCEQNVRGCYLDYRVHIGRAASDSSQSLSSDLQESSPVEVSVNPYKEATVLSTIGDVFGSAFDVLGDLVSFEFDSVFEDLLDMVKGLVGNIIHLFTPLGTKKERMADRVNSALDVKQQAVTQGYIEAAAPAFSSCRSLIKQLPGKYAEEYEKEFRAAMDLITQERSELQSKLDSRQAALSDLRSIESKLAEI